MEFKIDKRQTSSNNIKLSLLATVTSALLLTGCGTTSTQQQGSDDTTKNEQVVESVPQKIVGNNTVIPSTVPTSHPENPTKITGSSSIPGHDDKSYYLYGAEHLNLQNYYFDFPVVYNASVKKWIDYFLNKGRGFFERYSARAGRYAPILGAILEKHGLPRDLIFLAMAESGFQNNAKSWAQAVGPWQFMPYTGKKYGLKIDWYIDERQDPIKATVAAATYLKSLYEKFGSWELAAAGYNAGEGKVDRAIRKYKTENFWMISQGRYLKNETKNYVPKIMALAIIGKNLNAYGFDDIEFHEPLDFDEVKVNGGTDLMIFASKVNVDFEEIQRLNPEIKRWFTPLNVPEYILRVPVGTMAQAGNICENNSCVATQFKPYQTKSDNTSIRQIASKFKIKDPGVLAHINNTTPDAVFKRGQTVLLPFRAEQSTTDDMYADLYEKPRKIVLRRNQYRSLLQIAQKSGRAIKNPTTYYTVTKGDSLWSVARKNNVSIQNLIMTNYPLIKNRMIRVGDKLAIR